MEEEKAAYEIEVNTPSDIFPEYYLIKVNQFNQKIKDNLDAWIYLLKNSSVKENFQAKGIKAAVEKLHVMKLNDKQRGIYNAYVKDMHHEASMVESHYGKGKREGKIEGLKEGEVKGKAEGLKEGELKANLETARNMQAKGMDLHLIAELTGLTLTELEQLKY